MSLLDNYSAENDFRIFIQQFPASLFTEMTGGRPRREITKQHTGGGGPPVDIIGPTEVTDITLRKPLDPVTDGPILGWLAGWARGVRLPVTVIKQPVNSLGVPFGRRYTFRRCNVVEEGPPDARAGSSSAAMLEITLSVTEMI